MRCSCLQIWRIHIPCARWSMVSCCALTRSQFRYRVCGAEGHLPWSRQRSRYPNCQHGYSPRYVCGVSPVEFKFEHADSTGESKPFIRNVFTLNSCSHIVGSQVLCFDEEAEMLQAWRDFVEEVDPDLVIGYNIANFDLPYLLDRAKALKTNAFPFLGRMKSEHFLRPCKLH